MIDSQDRTGTRQRGSIQERRTGEREDQTHQEDTREEQEGPRPTRAEQGSRKHRTETEEHGGKEEPGHERPPHEEADREGQPAALGKVAGVHRKRFKRQKCEGQRAQTRNRIARAAEREHDSQERAQERAPYPHDCPDLLEQREQRPRPSSQRQRKFLVLAAAIDAKHVGVVRFYIQADHIPVCQAPGPSAGKVDDTVSCSNTRARRCCAG